MFDNMTEMSYMTPAPLVFLGIWAVLYAFMGIGAARVWAASGSPDRTGGLLIFAVQLAVNFFLNIIFFNAGDFQLAFWLVILLLVLIAAMTALFKKVDRMASRLQIPYFFWMIFMGYLTYMAWMIN